MSTILDFCYKKINYILNNLDMYVLKTEIEFSIPYNNSTTEKLKFKFIGQGTYKYVFRVKNLTSEQSIIPRNGYFVMAIMKSKHDEPERCLKIKKIIKKIKNQKHKKLERQIKLDLIRKYTTGILDVKKGKTNDVIFLEYIQGYDLKQLMVTKTLTQEDIDLIFLMSILSVRIFHKILKLSHRDLKLENYLWNSKDVRVQTLDYSFVCESNDMDCLSRVQGTPKYTHPKQNKRTLLKYNKKGQESPISIVKNNKTKKKMYNFPHSFSQDLYSCIIILLKLHYHHTKKHPELLNSSNRAVFDIVSEFNDSFVKRSKKIDEKRQRYKAKKILFKKLLALTPDQIYSPSLRVLISIIEKYWDSKKRDFVKNDKTGDVVASQILDELIYSLVNVTKLTTDKNISNSVLFKKEHKKALLDDVFKLQKLTISN